MLARAVCCRSPGEHRRPLLAETPVGSEIFELLTNGGDQNIVMFPLYFCDLYLCLYEHNSRNVLPES